MPTLADIAAYLDAELNIATIPDYPGAMNGVQVENVGDVTRVATAVDFSSFTIRAAIEAGAQLLLVHHGMFWGGTQAITGRHYERLRALIHANVAVYSAHLPLDVHAVFGNNALLANRLGLTPSGGFARFQTLDVGLSGESDISTSTLVGRAESLAHENGGAVVVTPIDANRMTRRWAVCTGAGASSSTLAEAIERGIDTLIVGEGPHHTAVEARDAGIAVIYAGHYATETLGVRALGAELERRFGVTSAFIEAPTGL